MALRNLHRARLAALERSRPLRIGLYSLGFAALVIAASTPYWARLPRRSHPLLGKRAYEKWAQEQFAVSHPGEKPMNWAIGAAAIELHRTQPMGKFVLSVTPGLWGNDCSDFVDCAVDEGLGFGTRLKRGARDHRLGLDSRVFDAIVWHEGLTIQPGDGVSVRHSPWYEPSEESCWHIGIIGTDMAVYDFVKLRRWSAARYGRNPFEWFIHNSRDKPGQVVIHRLRPEYRYRIEPIPIYPRPPLRMPAGASPGGNAQEGG
jgi:hypothetical protein